MKRKETIGVSDLSDAAQRRADKMGDEGDWVFARRRGRGWELAICSSTQPAADKVSQAYIDSGWQEVDFGR